MGFAELLSLGLALVPPGYCTYAWIAGDPLRMETHAASVALHFSLFASALLIAFGFNRSAVELTHVNGESLGQSSAFESARANWWSLLLLLAALPYGLTELGVAAASSLASPTWGAGISGGSGLLTWLILSVSLGIVPVIFEPTRMWLEDDAVRVSTYSTIEWQAIRAYVRSNRNVWLYLKGSKGMPYATLVLESQHADSLARTLEENGVEAWSRHPAAFLALRAGVAVAFVCLIGLGAAAYQIEWADPRATYVALVALGIFLTFLAEQPRNAGAGTTKNPGVETEEEHWLRARAELRGVLDDWRHGRATRAEVHAWAAEFLGDYGRVDTLVKNSSRVVLSDILTLLAQGETGGVEWGDVGVLAAALGAPPGEELEVFEEAGDLSRGPGVDRGACAEILRSWSNGELDETAVDQALLDLTHDLSPRMLPDSDPRSIGDAVFGRIFPVAWGDVLPEDAPACLAFLETPPGTEESAWGEWTRYWRETNYLERHDRLATKPYAATLDTPVRYASRAKLRSIVERWMKGASADATRERAVQVVERYGVLWCPLDDPACVSVEVGKALASLDQQLITVADGPALLECLAAEQGRERESLHALHTYFDEIDYDARIRDLKDDAAYTTLHLRRELERSRRDAPRRDDRHP